MMVVLIDLVTYFVLTKMFGYCTALLSFLYCSNWLNPYHAEQIDTLQCIIKKYISSSSELLYNNSLFGGQF